MMPHNVQLL